MRSLSSLVFRAVLGTLALISLSASPALSQTDIHISGPASGFSIAVPVLCNGRDALDAVNEVPNVVMKNLDISGLFKVIDRASYIETPGKCDTPTTVSFSDWSPIGAEGVVKGTVKQNGSTISVELYLYDVAQQRAVLGKRYEADVRDASRIAHKFSNEIVKYFTGELGIFGTQIAFVSKVGRFKELFLMDLDGSNVRQLTRDKGLAMSPSFSPSGDKLTFLSYAGRKPELYTMDLSTLSQRQFSRKSGIKLSPKFLRDGSGVIAAQGFDGITNLVVMDFEGNIVRRVTQGSSIDVSPSLSPDGTQIVFTSSRGGGPQIYLMSINGGEAKRVSYTGSNYCTSPAWSPKGDKVAFVCQSGGNQLFMGSPTGGTAIQLTFSGNNEDPAWSPDGRYVIFSSTMGGGNRGLALLNVTTGVAKKITNERTEDSQPAWSPRID